MCTSKPPANKTVSTITNNHKLSTSNIKTLEKASTDLNNTDPTINAEKHHDRSNV